MVMRKNKRYGGGGGAIRRRDVAEVINLLKKDSRDTVEINRIFQKAIKDRDIQLIRALLSNGVKVEAFNDSNQTAIHFAAENDCLKAIDSLFPYCDNDVNYTDVNGLTHFHVACITGSTSIVKHFLENGVDVNVRFRSDAFDERNDFTPLHFAVKNTKVEIVELLLRRRADANATDFAGRTPLHLACGIPEAIGDVILPKKVNVFHKNDEHHNKAIAIQNNTVEIVKLLVKYRSNVNLRDRNGDTPMCYIFHDGTVNYTEKRFLRNSLDFRIFNDVFRKTKRAIVKQLRLRQKLKLKLLLEHQAEVRIHNDNGDTILHRVIKDLKASRQLTEFGEPYFDDSVHVEMGKMILRHGADVDAKNKNGETALSIAVSVLSAEITGVLLKHKADVSALKLDHEARDYFHYPKVLPCLEATERLIEIVDLLQSRGFYLSQNDNLAILQFFVCNNVDCKYADLDDENASYKLTNLLELGTDGNIMSTLDKISRESRYLKGMISDQINRYLIKLQNDGLSVDREVEDCLRSRILTDFSEVTRQDLNDYKLESDKLKLPVLNNNKSLSEILTSPPDEIYSFLKNSDYKRVLNSGNFRKCYPHNCGIIKGYFAKSLVRRFVLKATNDYLRFLIARGLPDPCCERISSYLSNEDLWNLCLSSTIEVPSDEAAIQSLTSRLSELQTT